MICEHTAIFKRSEGRKRKDEKKPRKTNQRKELKRKNPLQSISLADPPWPPSTFVFLLCLRQQPHTLSVLVIKVKSALTKDSSHTHVDDAFAALIRNNVGLPKCR
jgi:hypothetical protein